MARSIQNIYDSMVAEGIRLATDAGKPAMVDMFNSTSRVAIWKIMFYAVAFCWNALDQIHDLFRSEIDETIASLKPGSARWYAEMAKKFQYGYNLLPESDQYNNTGISEDDITASRIVAYAAVVEEERGLRIKVAKSAGAELAPLTAPELSSFTAYMERIKYAGIKQVITSGVADDLKASLRIYYNPLVLSPTGGRIDGSASEPVQDALKAFLKNLPFNGMFVNQMAVDALQKVEGVVIVKDDSWQARYGALDYSNIDVQYNPDAGYLRLVEGGLTIQFIPHAGF